MKILTLVVVSAIVTMLLACTNEHQPSYEQLQEENERLHSQLAAALEHIETAEAQLEDVKTELSNAESAASAYRICEDAESYASSAESDADDVQSTLKEAKDELQ